jgi:hypothetical protein
MGDDRPQTTLGRYYARLDGFEPGDPLELVSRDVEFAIIYNQSEFAGGFAELEEYVRTRDPQGRFHDLLVERSDPGTEFVKGQVRTDAEQLGCFVATVELDGAGLIRRYLVGMSMTLSFELGKEARWSSSSP